MQPGSAWAIQTIVSVSKSVVNPALTSSQMVWPSPWLSTSLMIEHLERLEQWRRARGGPKGEVRRDTRKSMGRDRKRGLRVSATQAQDAGSIQQTALLWTLAATKGLKVRTRLKLLTPRDSLMG